jgi:hypothetical protein
MLWGKNDTFISEMDRKNDPQLALVNNYLHEPVTGSVCNHQGVPYSGDQQSCLLHSTFLLHSIKTSISQLSNITYVYECQWLTTVDCRWLHPHFMPVGDKDKHNVMVRRSLDKQIIRKAD